jgi:hypothetical protein
MHISSQKSSVVQRIAYQCYLGMVSLILLGILIEGLLIGPSVFEVTKWGRVSHAVLGALIFVLTLLLPLAGLLARLPKRIVTLSAVLWALALLQVISADLARGVPLMAALHPANALLMAALTMLLLIQAWQLRFRDGAR